MVIIYTTPTCVFCHATKEYLKNKKVKFKEEDLTQNHEAAQWVMQNTGQLAVPVTDIDGKIIIGFDRPSIDAALAKQA